MLFLLACAGEAPSPSTAALSEPTLWVLTGGEAGGRAGMAVDFAGDLNGDGTSEVLIGAPYADDAGVVWVLPGQSRPEAPLSLTVSAHALHGSRTGDAAGFSVAGVGDADGDGIGDVLVGAWGEDSVGTDAGRAWLVAGPVTADAVLDDIGEPFSAEASYDNFGFTVAGAGDIDGDGLADLLIGAPFHDDGGSRAGTVFLHSASGTTRFIGGRSGDELGQSMSTAGDLNGDGLDDVVLGAWRTLTPDKQRPGAAWMWYGPVSGTQDAWGADLLLLGEEDDDRAGAAVTDAGDLNGDGLGDVAVGSTVGRVWLVAGATEGGAQRVEAAGVLDGLAAAQVGAALSAAGDLDGDGFDDLLIGAPGWDQPAVNTGGFGVLYGAASLEGLKKTWWSLDGEGTMAGISVAGGGDADGDGLPDLLVGGQGGGEEREGAAWLLPGASW